MNRSSDSNAEPSRPSRRRFLGIAAAAAGGLVLRRSQARAFEGELLMPPGAAPSRVAEVSSAHITDGPTVHRPLLGEMVERVLISLTDEPTPTKAWKSLLGSAEVVGLKFNQSGQTVIATAAVMAETLVVSLTEAGWPPNRVILIEAPAGVAELLGTMPGRAGFAPAPTDFGSGSDQFAAVLGQVDALISVPFLKTHNIAGMTGGLKNLSHGLVKHPARYHADGCSPFIGDIVAAPPIRSKLRLVFVDALRVVFAEGPTARADRLSDEGIILASTDPVAADAVGLSILNETRERKGMAMLADSPAGIPHLASAHRRRLGIAVQHGIDRIAVSL